jgi:hypothetical protein
VYAERSRVAGSRDIRRSLQTYKNQMSASIVTALAEWSSLPVEGVKAYVGKDRSSTGLLAAHHALRQFATDKCVPLDVADAVLQARLGELRMVERKEREVAEKALKEARAAAALIAAAEAVVARKAAEEARKIAAAAAVEFARTEQHTATIRMAKGFLQAQSSHPTVRPICHNFQEADPELFVVYVENMAAPAGVVHLGESNRHLRVHRATSVGISDAFECPQSTASWYIPPRDTIPVPAAWASHYDLGMIPFLPVCPTCAKATEMHRRAFGGGHYQGGQVECSGHYKWEATTDQHFRWEKMPPRPTFPGQMHFGSPWPEGRWVLWNPRDPDGSRAAAAAKEAKAVSIRKQIAELEGALSSCYC